ncbi:hypothetical protein J0J24_02400 [Vibrio vulnificus]|nr:hypothetical protein [Vibrio vulnificus]
MSYISVSTDQTFGGFSVSFVIMGDANMDEPKARIGFAGRKVIKQTVLVRLPVDFQQRIFCR